MLYKHITIDQLTNIQANYNLGIKGYICAKLIKVGKDKIYHYYKLFKADMTVLEIFNFYKLNKTKCGRKEIIFSESKISQVKELIDKDWSVDAICGRDKLENKPEKCSTKTLYRMVEDGVFDASKLRRKGKRKPNNHEETRGKINNCKTIHERDEKYPKVCKNEVFGHFEGDTIIGEKRKSAIVTLVDKESKYIVLLKASRKSQDVSDATCNWLKGIGVGIVNTITFDRGKEFSKWKEIEQKSETEIYFSDPGSPGQRGLNENSNGIVRKDLPKSTDLSVHTQEELNQISKKWNSIPRRSLGYKTPEEVLKEATGLETLLPAA